MSKPEVCPKCGDCPGNQAHGAARERRRIRRAQREALKALRDEVSTTTGNLWACGIIDNATRSRGKGKRA